MLLTALFPRHLASVGREALAFAKHAWLLRHDLGAPVVPHNAKDGEHVVVFLHGLMASAGVLRPLRAAVQRHAEVHSASFTYGPGPGIEELAQRLGDLLGELPAHAHVHLVGHSLGGLVARYFAQEVGDPRVVQTISLASPFAGVPNARLLGMSFARDLDAGSPLLRRISLGAARSAHLPHLSIVAADDAIVRAPVSHALPGFDVVVLDGCGHNTLLYDDEAVRLVAGRVRSRL